MTVASSTVCGQEAGGDQEQGGALLGPEVRWRRDPGCGGGAGQQNTGGAGPGCTVVTFGGARQLGRVGT